MSLTGIAQQTVAIAEQGRYAAPSGRAVSLRAEVDGAVHGTRLYTPEATAALLEERAARAPAHPAPAPRFEVTPETTAEAGRRLVEAEGERRVLALNFASARNPGGGFLRGAKAQEEDLARCSALYACQITQRAYYDANRVGESLLYTDHLIYSPEVPFFRDERGALLEAPFLLSILTAPAPNAGEHLRREPDGRPAVREALERRARKLLAVAAEQGHACLILGAWGCGVFRNEPAEVAEVFAKALAEPPLRGAFRRVVFAVYDRSPGQATLAAFQARFAPGEPGA